MIKDRIAALILAAGRSSRMGDFKPLLPLGETTVIGRAIENFEEAGVDSILVVAGFAAERLIPALRKRGVAWVVNQDHDRGMYSSLRAGVLHLASSCEAFFVLPADHPFVRPATITALMSAFRHREDSISVCRPAYRGRRGHPPLISSRLVPVILDFNEDGGLRQLLSLHEKETLTVDGDDPGILVDLDSREDYRRAGERIAGLKPGRTSDKA